MCPPPVKAVVLPPTVFRTTPCSALKKPAPLLSESDQRIRLPPLSTISTFGESEMLPAARRVRLAVAEVVTSAETLMFPDAEMTVEKLAM